MAGIQEGICPGPIKHLVTLCLDAYRTEAVKIFKQPSPPSYSFGSRTRYHRKGSAPAPNAYTLPNMIGMRIPSKSAPPAFSMAGRPRVGGFSEDLQKVCKFFNKFIFRSLRQKWIFLASFLLDNAKVRHFQTFSNYK